MVIIFHVWTEIFSCYLYTLTLVMLYTNFFNCFPRDGGDLNLTSQLTSLFYVSEQMHTPKVKDYRLFF